MKSYQIDLTNKNVEEILIENDILDDEDLAVVNSLSKKFTGYGHYEISAHITNDSHDSIDLKAIITDMSIVDEWNEDDCYFENEESWFENAKAVMNRAFEIIVQNNIEELNEFISKSDNYKDRTPLTLQKKEWVLH